MTTAPDDAATLPLRIGSLDLRNGHVRTPEGERVLSGGELRLLCYLVERAGTVVPRGELLAEVWGYHPDSTSRAVDDMIRRLRRRIERDPAAPEHLLTVYGGGYRFVPDADVLPQAPAVPAPAAGLVLPTCTVDLDRRRVRSHDGTTALLTAREAALLERLARARGAVVSREDIARDVWGTRRPSRAIDNTVQKLRARIEADPARPALLLTARGEGYRLVGESSHAPLPPERDAFVGRDAELEALRARCDTHHLVTVLGPGGIGKTRLVRRFARQQGAALIGLCELSEARTREDILAAVATTLAGDGAPTSADLSAWLPRLLGARGAGVLILDNVEQIVPEAGDLVGEWLAAAPALRVVVTSRVRLKRKGEQVLELGPLPLADAVRLFEVRAPDTRPADAAIVETLVQQLDRIPLAIELASARATLLPPAALLARIDQRLSLLRQDGPDAPARHATLLAAIDWSWALLSAQDRALLGTIATFEGSFSLEAAEALAPPAQGAVLDGLQTLRDSSLLQVEETAGQVRFRLLESIRDFARSARDPGAEPATRARYIAWFDALAQELIALGREHGRDEGSQRLRPELRDLLVACDAALPTDPVISARILMAIAAWHRRTGGSRELLGRIEHVLAVLPEHEPVSRAWLELERVMILVLSHGLSDAELEAIPEQVLALARAQDAPWLALQARVCQLLIAHRRGRIGDMRVQASDALQIAWRLGSADRIGAMWSYLGVVERLSGDQEAARQAYSKALEVLGKERHERARAVAANNLGVLELDMGRYRTAVRMFEETADLSHESDMVQNAKANLGIARWMLGEVAEGEALISSMITAFQQQGESGPVAILSGHLGRLLLLDGRWEEGERALWRSLQPGAPVGGRLASLCFLALCDARQGSPEEAQVRLAEAASLHTTNPALRAVVRVVTASVAGDLAAGLAEVRAATDDHGRPLTSGSLPLRQAMALVERSASPAPSP